MARGKGDGPIICFCITLALIVLGLLVFFVILLMSGLPLTFHMLWQIPILALASLLGLGLANLFATIQVYFRDTQSFLPYFTRIWLYLSPVIWTAEAMAGTKFDAAGQCTDNPDQADNAQHQPQGFTQPCTDGRAGFESVQCPE